MKSILDQNFYELLEVQPDAPTDEIERAYQIAHSTYDTGSLALYSVFEEGDAVVLRERLDTAYRVLSDSASRREYDAAIAAECAEVDLEANGNNGGSVGPLEIELELPLEIEFEAEAEPQIIASSSVELGEFDDFEDDPEDTVYDGDRLRRARLRRELELEHIASITKITPTYLSFLEEDRFDDLPAPVYVRGFVTAYARCVGLDPALVARSYMERFESTAPPKRSRKKNLFARS